jgi:hypothetical protein
MTKRRDQKPTFAQPRRIQTLSRYADLHGSDDMRMQRKSGLTGRTAAAVETGERPLWAGCFMLPRLTGHAARRSAARLL